jgi:hypothetical protein
MEVRRLVIFKKVLEKQIKTAASERVSVGRA